MMRQKLQEEMLSGREKTTTSHAAEREGKNEGLTSPIVLGNVSSSVTLA
jgi:hypothetical protein